MSDNTHTNQDPTQVDDIGKIANFLTEYDAIDIHPDPHSIVKVNGGVFPSLNVIQILRDLTSGSSNAIFNALKKKMTTFSPIKGEDEKVTDYVNETEIPLMVPRTAGPCFLPMISSLVATNESSLDDKNDTDGWISTLLERDEMNSFITGTCIADDDYQVIDVTSAIAQMKKVEELTLASQDTIRHNEVQRVMGLLTKLELSNYFITTLYAAKNNVELDSETITNVGKDFFDCADVIAEYIATDYETLAMSILDAITLFYFSLGFNPHYKSKPISVSKYLMMTRAGSDKVQTAMTLTYDSAAFDKAIKLYHTFSLSNVVTKSGVQWSLSTLIPKKTAEDIDAQSQSKDPKYNQLIVLLTAMTSEGVSTSMPTQFQFIHFLKDSTPLKMGSITEFGSIQYYGENNND